MEGKIITTADRIAQYREFMGDFSDSFILDKLIHLGFFEAPASTKYHGNYPGGLFDHSIKVAEELVSFTRWLNLKWQLSRSPYIIGMYHDLCKCDSYEMDEAVTNSQVKTCGGGYIYSSHDAFPGHGAKSVMVLSQIHQLTEEEVFCVRYHMGAYEKEEWNYFDRAIRKYPNVLWTHTADMSASKIHNV